jgi:hypothetical protein
VRVGGRPAGLGTLLTLGLALAGCSHGERPAQASSPDTLKWHGMYVSDTLPSAGGLVEWVAYLNVGPDTQAFLAIEFLHSGTVYRRGIWRARGRELTFEPRREDGMPLGKVLVWRLDSLRLEPVRWDRELFGTGGIPLTKQPPAAPTRAADTTTGGTS